jgi:5-hydroxyisourate hydrolase-like protein (transthyretin family)
MLLLLIKRITDADGRCGTLLPVPSLDTAQPALQPGLYRLRFDVSKYDFGLSMTIGGSSNQVVPCFYPYAEVSLSLAIVFFRVL